MITELQFEDGPTIDGSSGEFESYPEYRWERIVDETTFESVKRIRVRVYWDDRNPTACELVLQPGAAG